jgi:hypothetical protein
MSFTQLTPHRWVFRVLYEDGDVVTAPLSKIFDGEEVTLYMVGTDLRPAFYVVESKTTEVMAHLINQKVSLALFGDLDTRNRGSRLLYKDKWVRLYQFRTEARKYNYKLANTERKDKNNG